MKSLNPDVKQTKLLVTPCVGVWIEICVTRSGMVKFVVTPCVGVWIEILPVPEAEGCRDSHSLRGSVD